MIIGYAYFILFSFFLRSKSENSGSYSWIHPYLSWFPTVWFWNVWSRFSGPNEWGALGMRVYIATIAITELARSPQDWGFAEEPSKPWEFAETWLRFFGAWQKAFPWFSSSNTCCPGRSGTWPGRFQNPPESSERQVQAECQRPRAMRRAFFETSMMQVTSSYPVVVAKLLAPVDDGKFVIYCCILAYYCIFLWYIVTILLLPWFYCDYIVIVAYYWAKCLLIDQ